MSFPDFLGIFIFLFFVTESVSWFSETPLFFISTVYDTKFKITDRNIECNTLMITSICQDMPAYSINRQDFFPASDTQFPMLKYNFNMLYTMTNMIYFNFHSVGNESVFFCSHSCAFIYVLHVAKPSSAKIYCGLTVHSRWAVVNVIKCKCKFLQERSQSWGKMLGPNMRMLTMWALNEDFLRSMNKLLVQVNSISSSRHVTGQGRSTTE